MRTVRLGDVSTAIRGVTFSVAEAMPEPGPGLIACLTTSGVHNPIRWSTVRYVPDHLVDARQLLRTGDVLVSTANSKAMVGKSAFVPSPPFPCTFGAFVTTLRPRPQMDSTYLSLWMQSDEFLDRARDLASQTTNIANLRVADLLGMPIDIPERAEDQRRIAEVLSVAVGLAAVAAEAARSRLSKARTLRATTIRELVPLPFGGNSAWVPLAGAAEFLDQLREPVNLTERAARLSGSAGPRYPYFGANGQAGWIDAYRFNEELVLLAEDGGAFGSDERPIAYRVSGPCWVNNHAHVLRALPGVDVDYLGYALGIRPDVGALISGSTRGKLNRRTAASILVPMPSLADQRRIAAELRERLDTIDQMTRAIDAQMEAIEALPAAILRRAFEEIEAA